MLLLIFVLIYQLQDLWQQRCFVVVDNGLLALDKLVLDRLSSNPVIYLLSRETATFHDPVNPDGSGCRHVPHAIDHAVEACSAQQCRFDKGQRGALFCLFVSPTSHVTGCGGMDNAIKEGELVGVSESHLAEVLAIQSTVFKVSLVAKSHL